MRARPGALVLALVAQSCIYFGAEIPCATDANCLDGQFCDDGTCSDGAPPPEDDGGPPGPPDDAGPPEPDAGRPAEDAGRPEPDAGRPAEDAGPPPVDAGAPCEVLPVTEPGLVFTDDFGCGLGELQAPAAARWSVTGDCAGASGEVSGTTDCAFGLDYTPANAARYQLTGALVDGSSLVLQLSNDNSTYRVGFNGSGTLSISENGSDVVVLDAPVITSAHFEITTTTQRIDVAVSDRGFASEGGIARYVLSAQRGESAGLERVDLELRGQARLTSATARVDAATFEHLFADTFSRSSGAGAEHPPGVDWSTDAEIDGVLRTGPFADASASIVAETSTPIGDRRLRFRYSGSGDRDLSFGAQGQFFGGADLAGVRINDLTGFGVFRGATAAQETLVPMDEHTDVDPLFVELRFSDDGLSAVAALRRDDFDGPLLRVVAPASFDFPDNNDTSLRLTVGLDSFPSLVDDVFLDALPYDDTDLALFDSFERGALARPDFISSGPANWENAGTSSVSGGALVLGDGGHRIGVPIGNLAYGPGDPPIRVRARFASVVRQVCVGFNAESETLLQAVVGCVNGGAVEVFETEPPAGARGSTAHGLDLSVGEVFFELLVEGGVASVSVSQTDFGADGPQHVVSLEPDPPDAGPPQETAAGDRALIVAFGGGETRILDFSIEVLK